MTARDRHTRARLAGGRKLDPTRWERLVERAAAEIERDRAALSSYIRSDVPPPSFRHYDERCPPGSFPISAQMVLDLETTMAEMSMLAAELEEMGAREELAEGYRASLLRTLERARDMIKERLRDDQRSHLKVIE